MAVKKRNAKSIPVDATRHKDKRANIPTEELRDFVAADEAKPQTVLYPRDPSLDPQLVWKGKDEQDREDLAVPAVPVYIQEKIHPKAIIENVRAEAKKGVGAHRDAPLQMALFADFNGLEFEELIEFYQHEQNWANRMILGDSLLVMTSLAEKEGLKGKVQMIYVDPPYGIKFGSNWQVSTRKRDVRDGKGEDATRQPEQIKAFRDTWELGIHSYLAYLRDRLVAARELLTETGSVFVQIGDENVHLVRCLMDEVFGSENFIAIIPFSKTGGFSAGLIDSVADYLVWYGKDRKQTKYRQMYKEKEPGQEGGTKYTSVEMPDGTRKPISPDQMETPSLLPEGARILRLDTLVSQGFVASASAPYDFQGHPVGIAANLHWKTTRQGMNRLAAAQRISRTTHTLGYVRYLDDFRVFPISNVSTDIGGIQSRADPKVYVVQTATKAVERCMLMTTDPGDLVLDPTCGSGTTAYVAEQWGRRWITIDTSRVALALARTRLMSARFPYYVLADSPEGVQKEAEITGSVGAYRHAPPQHDVKKGFVYKRVPHITLKSIANNEEIDVIHAHWQEQIEPLRERLNATLKQTWEEWQVPREASPDWPEEAKRLHGEFWRLRRERQREIDASIARNAAVELLYDQPYEDPRRIRVTGPLTVGEPFAPPGAGRGRGAPRV